MNTISPSLYSPLFDKTHGGMNRDYERRVGLVTALLLVRQQEWIHRRVEVMTFEDRYVLRRNNSLDFTFPRWAFEIMGFDGLGEVTVAVPLTLFRKDTLVHFGLTDESSASIPLLSAQQAVPLARMALMATAELVLNTGELPSSIVDDIYEVTSEPPASASNAYKRLFSEKRTNPAMRRLLKEHQAFRSLAGALVGNYIAAVLLSVSPDTRRIIHFAYDEGRRFTDESHLYRLRTTLNMLAGRRSHSLLVSASSAGEAASFHIEAEAPEGLQINSKETFYGAIDRKPDQKVVGIQRLHVHYSDLPPGAPLAVRLRLNPRSSTVVRGAALTSGLTLLAVSYALIQLDSITSKKGTAAAAAVLLIIPTILSVWITRTNEHPVTTHLLWPIRIVATAPAVLGFMAAGVLVTGGDDPASESVLGVLIGSLLLATIILMGIWRRAADRERQAGLDQNA